jgi:hypothetical protein
MPSAFAKHAVQAKPNEQGDEGEDDDYGQGEILNVSAANIVRLS